MQLLHGIDGLRRLAPGSILSIGNFDGVHLGHRHLLRMARELRDRDGGQIAIVTFEPHPLTILRPELAPPRLTTAAVKQGLIEKAGVDQFVTLPPTRDVLDLSAEQFWQILRDGARPRHLIEGDSFTFGKDRGGNIGRLREWSASSDIALHVVEPVEVALLDMLIVPMSSSIIRWLLACGRVRDAAICLGRAYAIEGPVIKGHQRGRTIGVPTINLDVGDQHVPADGVYSGRCEVDGATYAAAVSIGTMPTFGQNRRQVEAHLIEFDGDLYGRTVRLEMLDWVREQIRFNGIDALKARMRVDIEVARQQAERFSPDPIATC